MKNFQLMRKNQPSLLNKFSLMALNDSETTPDKAK